jgi:hypothetical protein
MAIGRKEAPAPFAGMEKRQLKTQYDRWRSRQTSGRKMLRKALKLHFQEREFDAELEDLAMDYWQVDGQLQVTSRPIVITDPKNTARFRAISTNRFLQIDVWELKAKGGTWEDLFEAEDDEQTIVNPVVVPPVTNMVDVEARMKDITTFLNGDWEADSRERVESIRNMVFTSWKRLEEVLKQNQPPTGETRKAA